MSGLDERERYCKGRLIELQRRYTEEAKPWIDQLVAIERMRPAQPVWLMVPEGGEAKMRELYPQLFEVPPTQEP